MRADRLLSMLILLQAYGNMTTQALAEKLEVSRRTILRDIDALSIAGIPITAEGGPGGGIFLDKNYHVSLTGLNAAEVQTLFVSGPSGPLKDMGLTKAAEDVMLKLVAALSLRQRKEVERFQQHIHFDPVWWQQEEKITPFLSLLQNAVFQNHRLQVVYEGRGGERTERIIEPYGLVAKGDTWYLVATREGEFRTYRVSRFHEIKPLDQLFQRCEPFDLPSYWKDYCQEFEKNLPQFSFTLKVDPKYLHFLTWYAQGQFRIEKNLEQEKDEWLTVHLTLSSLEAACVFVLRAGQHTRVIEPPELSSAVIKAAQEILAFHTQ